MLNIPYWRASHVFSVMAKLILVEHPILKSIPWIIVRIMELKYWPNLTEHPKLKSISCLLSYGKTHFSWASHTEEHPMQVTIMELKYWPNLTEHPKLKSISYDFEYNIDYWHIYDAHPRLRSIPCLLVLIMSILNWRVSHMILKIIWLNTF